MNKTAQLILLLALVAVTSWLPASNPPANLSPRGIVEWAEVGGHIASGTGPLPAVATAGSRYTDVSTPSTPVDYRSNGSAWVPISGSGGDGVATHSELAGLDFSSSGHTGFASTGSIITAHGGLTGLDFAGSGHTGFASTGSIITNHSGLGNLDFAGSGHTGFASAAGLSSTDASLSAHVADQTDAHGATQTISVGVTLGTGTPDAFIERIASGVIQIATWARIIPSVASPTSPATGTIWQDASGCYRVFDGNGSWSKILTDYPVWQDLRVSLLSTNSGGTNPPTPVKVVGNGSSQGVFAYSFDAGTEEEVYASIQLPHDCYKTYVSPHLHWAPQSTNVATVTLGIEYSLANYLATYPTTTIATIAVTTPGVNLKHMITEFPAIDISGAKDSAVMLIRIFRAAADARDTYAQEVFLTDFDLHYQVKDRGSKSLYGDN